MRKLSQMILDKKLTASLDQEKGLLIMLPESTEHAIAEDAIEAIDMMTEVVDVLKTRADAYNAKLQELWSVCWRYNEWTNGWSLKHVSVPLRIFL